MALYGGGAVHHYSAQGRLEQIITVDARNVTACTFGGPDLSQLFITTSRENLDPGQDPLAGAIFTATPGVTGRTVQAFRG